MFVGLSNGLELVKESFSAFKRHPVLLAPLLAVWCVYAPGLLYVQFYLDFSGLSQGEALLLMSMIIFIFTFLLAFSGSVLLELLQQLESGKETKLHLAVWQTARHNLLRIIPIVFIWTVIWVLLALIQALVSRRNSSDKSEELTAQSAVEALAGFDSLSLSAAFFAALQKGVRMTVFLILPAIAWDDLPFRQAIKHGLSVFKTNLSSFVSGFVLTNAVVGAILIPPGLLFWLSGEFSWNIPDWLWLLTIVYMAFGWSYSIYLEQMFSAGLYLWNRKWQIAVEKAEREGTDCPAFEEIQPPSVIDDVYELSDRKLVRSTRPSY